MSLRKTELLRSISLCDKKIRYYDLIGDELRKMWYEGEKNRLIKIMKDGKRSANESGSGA